MSEVIAKEFIPSPYQAAFFDFIKNGRGSCILMAVAGAGKTTSVIKSLNYIPSHQTVRLLAFNSLIARELQERVLAEGCDPQRVMASTFHSLGNGAVFRHLRSRGVVAGKPDPKKPLNLLRNLVGEEDLTLYGDFVTRLVGLARGEGVGVLVPDVPQTWLDLISHHDLALDTEEADEGYAVALAQRLLRACNQAALQGVIDFDDQLYLPLLWKLRLFQNDWVFVDEAQDTSPVRRALAKLALRPGGRLIAVGDACQSIYGFSGASADAMDVLKREFNAIELPLTVSYRCAKSIVRQAQRTVSHIEAFEGAPEGEVLHLPIRDALPLLGAGDAILCRNMAPLVTLAYRLIGSGRGCHLLGRDIGAGLVSLIKKARARTIDGLEGKLTEWRDREVAKHMARGEEQRAEAISDRVESIFAVIGGLSMNDRTIPKLVEGIEGMFSDSGGRGVLVLSTIHKAKGREWPTVAVLREDLSPSRYARQDWQQVQEQNLIYVRDTRAQTRLIFMREEARAS